ncbi:MAG TPA: folate-binding protein [Rhodanobacteraceae bacterium]|nr:folate-binding protein [Rhodanobacteraceae bacterium]
MRAPSGSAQCIEISGADARAFAQAQFAGNVRTLQAGHWQWNAWLDAKGSVRALMHLADLGDDRLFALLRGGDARLLCAALKPYVLRAKISLDVSNGWRRHAGAGLSHGMLAAETDAIGFGYGDRSLWLKRDETDAGAESGEAMRLADIQQGWPTLPPGDHVFLPPALGLEHLGAVSFDKGCYPGQEIAARLHYRGGHKLRLCHVRTDGPMTAGQPLSPAQPRAIVLDALVTPRGCEALAVLEEDAQGLSGIEITRRFEP